MRDDGITLVFLTKGRVAIIDSAEAELVLSREWYFNPSPAGHGYAVRTRRKDDGPGTNTIHLHRVILGVECDVDHINGDKLDNRRCNLRPANRSNNNANGKIRSDNTSGYRGVYWHRANSKWVAQIQRDGKAKYIGSFFTAEEAAMAWDAAALEAHGEFAHLNFPPQ